MQDPQRLLVLALLDYVDRKNASASQLCDLIGLEQNRLKQHDLLGLTAKQTDDLWVNAAQLTHDPLFGLHFGESMQLTALGVVGGLIQTSRTIGEALTQAAAFASLITDMVGMTSRRTSDRIIVDFQPNEARRELAPAAFRHQMDMFMAFTIREIDGLVLRRVSPSQVTYPADPAYQAEYERVLRGPIRQSVGDCNYQLVLDGSYWDEPIITANYDMQRLWLKQATERTQAIRDAKTMSVRIRQQLLATAYLGIPSLDDVAANLNVSSRSLQRKLQEEGVTYQQLADSIRKSLAIHYLDTRKYSIKEIAYLLGYNELSAFTRAFKRWTGASPIHYRP
ncbi:AraC family transcriptional regulator ligand-binding domain-containing protein [uncultured Fibrella sp.]|uniref:AraC family transcriptional regulator n=1 Tax=uncultured Fibrella sp. TaxID=1284596 RepID=UPI0035CAF02A